MLRIATKGGGIEGYVTVQERKFFFWRTIAKFSIYVYGLPSCIVKAEYLKEKLEQVNE